MTDDVDRGTGEADDIVWAGAAALAERLRAGEVSAREVAEVFLERIDRLDQALNAISTVRPDEVRAQAAALDAAADRGGPLHGVPIVIKEELDVEGFVTTFGGRANSTPAAADGEVVRRLREAGAVILAKTHMPEFGQWPYTEGESFGHTHNPWDHRRSPGGSSGGTGAAVAAGLAPVGMGGDGGGSIRIPSAACGLFGLKPQRGRVTTAPHPDLWCSLGTVGPLARSVLDSALVYDVVRGRLAPTDRYRAEEPATTFVEAAGAESRRLRVGWSVKPVVRGIRVDPQHVQAVQEAASLLAELGHSVEEVDPRYPDTTAAFLPQFFGGVRDEIAIVEEPSRLESRTKQTGWMGAWARPGVVRRAVALGEGSVAGKANRVFDTCDVLLTPTIAHRPPEVGVLDGANAVQAQLRSLPMVAFAALWNVAGNPAANLPWGLGSDGLPLGVQIVGRPHAETTLLTLAAQVERERPWAGLRPPGC